VVQKWQRDRTDRLLTGHGNARMFFAWERSQMSSSRLALSPPVFPSQTTIINQDSGWRLLRRR
jgi:hypothetical protein